MLEKENTLSNKTINQSKIAFIENNRLISLEFPISKMTAKNQKSLMEISRRYILLGYIKI